MLWWIDDVYTAAECRGFIRRIESSRPELATNNPLYRDQDRVIFQHKLRHEGCEVTSGAKYAMRTDVVYGAFGSRAQ